MMASSSSNDEDASIPSSCSSLAFKSTFFASSLSHLDSELVNLDLARVCDALLSNWRSFCLSVAVSSLFSSTKLNPMIESSL
ncbi:hypothetical protein OGAPHI_000728 [Ogataea philodendri]|uniref:Uncharacterized protein n=1 Tax=Ogataea philodendri TaxID=1378263 RepID=A0A9P8PFQ5_9ASCO|nr:uncharacterized protein OGAPHI_000728 [Ogataea philodendri]KAH3671017.1 hypothetical protein OGAPHI_000728 [Ogataea philodendri]